MGIVEVFTLVIAFLGLSLGIINTFWSLTRDKARLHISCRYEPPNPNWNPPDHQLFVAIGNSSFFALTINGIYLANWFGFGIQEVNFFQPKPSSSVDSPWPTPLAQGAEMTFNLSRSALDVPALGIKPNISWWNSSLVIKTATGERFCKRNGAVRAFLRSEPLR